MTDDEAEEMEVDIGEEGGQGAGEDGEVDKDKDETEEGKAGKDDDKEADEEEVEDAGRGEVNGEVVRLSGAITQWYGWALG